MDHLQIVRDAFPISRGLGSLELVDPDPAPEVDCLWIRLFIWEPSPDGERQVHDVREQQIRFYGLADLDPERLTHAVRGWSMALAQLFDRDDATWLEKRIPVDLIPSFSRLVALKRPRSAEDFAEAMLSSKRWFGPWFKP
jgi:hypothetical protein